MPPSERLARLWPPYALRIVTPRLELRLATDEELADLAERVAVADAVVTAEWAHLMTWSRAPSPDRERNVLQWAWRWRAALTPEAWRLPLGVYLRTSPDTAIGSMDVVADDFAVTRSVTTGSWLLRTHAGQGLGTEARAGVLEFAFRGLGAVEARSQALIDNGPSNGVSRRLGYTPDGSRIVAVEGVGRPSVRWRMDAGDWRSPVPVELTGVELLRPMLGADAPRQ